MQVKCFFIFIASFAQGLPHAQEKENKINRLLDELIKLLGLAPASL
jgi:hypothetical protein